MTTELQTKASRCTDAYFGKLSTLFSEVPTLLHMFHLDDSKAALRGAGAEYYAFDVRLRVGVRGKNTEGEQHYHCSGVKVAAIGITNIKVKKDEKQPGAKGKRTSKSKICNPRLKAPKAEDITHCKVIFYSSQYERVFSIVVAPTEEVKDYYVKKGNKLRIR